MLKDSVAPAVTEAPLGKAVISSHDRSRLARIFSFPVMCMFVLAAAIFAYCPRGIDEPDIWWHMNDARYLLEHHRLPSVNTYTFAGVGSPWINQQWLSEIPYLIAFRKFGLQGLLLTYFVVLVLIFATVYYRSCLMGADCKDAAVATLGAICLGGVSLAPRTLLFGWLCLSALLLVLDHFKRTGHGLWLLPPLFALWINLHGSWVFGMVVLLATIGAGLFQGKWGAVVARRWRRRDLEKLVLSFLASTAALFLNPFGRELVFYPRFLLAHQRAVMQNIEEWQSADFGTWNGTLVLLLILGLFLVFVASARRYELDQVLLVAFALWAALSHARFMFFAGLIIVPIMAPSLKLFTPYEPEKDKPWLNAIIMVGLVAAMILMYPPEAQLQSKVDSTFPRDAVDFMRRNSLSGKVFNQYGWGAYLEWNAPEIPVFIDGRADVFVYNGVFDDDMRAAGLNGSLGILDRYGIDYVLLRPEEPLAYLLQHSPGWQLIYADNVAVLLGRASTQSTS